MPNHHRFRPARAVARVLALGGAVLLLLGLPVSAQTAAKEPDAPPVSDNPRADLDATLLAVASNYREYTRVSDYANWAPTLCTGPSQGPSVLSRSGDDATHGGKLYFLYAKDGPFYLDATGRRQSGPAGTGEDVVASPVGQTIVKESWAAVEVGAEEAAAWEHTDPAKRDVAKAPVARDGRFYRPGERRELFVMRRMDAATPDTDDGWIYATISADGSRVTASGRITSCMECHAKAPHGRLFGLPKGGGEAAQSGPPGHGAGAKGNAGAGTPRLAWLVRISARAALSRPSNRPARRCSRRSSARRSRSARCSRSS